jgi:hypothetical protein
MCLDKRLSSSLFKNQITKLFIAIDSNQDDLLIMENMCNCIFTVFSKLTHLIFNDVSYKNIIRLTLGFEPPRFSSSTLLVLNIKVQTFDECLYILDGRLSQLHTLYIDTNNIFLPEKEIPDQVSVTRKKN